MSHTTPEIEERIDEAFKEGVAHGRLEEKKGWVSNHGEGLCTSLEVLMPPIRDTADAATQATPTSAETASQTNNTPKRRCAALQVLRRWRLLAHL